MICCYVNCQLIFYFSEGFVFSFFPLLMEIFQSSSHWELVYSTLLAGKSPGVPGNDIVCSAGGFCMA